MDETKSHPIFTAFEAVGYPAHRLTDPAHISPDDVNSGEWRIVQWNSHGVEMFDVTEAVESDRGNIAFEVPFGGKNSSMAQPVGFADEYGPLNAEIDTLTQLKAAANPKVLFFAPREREDAHFDSPADAVEALDLWGSEGWIPWHTADAMVDAFGGEPLSPDLGKADPDADGVRIVRASTVARKVAAAAGLSPETADSDISGHKKRRRQRFYRALSALKEETGFDRDD